MFERSGQFGQSGSQGQFDLEPFQNGNKLIGQTNVVDLMCMRGEQHKHILAHWLSC